MKRQFLLVLIISFVVSWSCYAQDDLMKMAQSEKVPVNDVTLATFKATRLINQPTLECLGARTLDFRISHRFGELNSGSYNAYGIDGPANIRIGLDYSYDGRLMVGIGRTSLGNPDKLFDGFLKYRLLRQKDNGGMPLSVTLFTSIAYTSQVDPTVAITGQDKYYYPTDRLAYAHEVIVGKKFSPKFSLQLSGFLVHNNLTMNIGDKNNVYAIGGATRYKITKSFAITAEYSYCLNNYYTIAPTVHYYDSMGIGFEIETGGHVFQVHLTNSFGISETQYIPFTTSTWANAGIRVGFNISRVFHL